MALLPIILAPDDRLLVRSKEVEQVDDNVRKLLDDMLETMHSANGVGLAAVQVGIHKRIFIAEIPRGFVLDEDDESEKFREYQGVGGPYFLINPVISQYSSDCVNFREGCLSVPKQFGELMRPRRIIVEALDYNGKKQTIMARGWLARCFQHEIDHLNGKLFIQLLSKLKYDMAIQKAQKVKRSLSQG